MMSPLLDLLALCKNDSLEVVMGHIVGDLWSNLAETACGILLLKCAVSPAPLDVAKRLRHAEKSLLLVNHLHNS